MASKAEKIKAFGPEVEVEIEHKTTGERYGVTMGVYREYYAGHGFEVDRYADGTAIQSDRDTVESEPAPEPVGPLGPVEDDK